MNVLPVVKRELHEQARQPSTYWLRLLGAAGLLAVGVVITLDRGVGYRRGQSLFSSMHWVLFGVIWGLVPIMTADCISRERREGTLGLLFLTPLKALDVVLAKSLAHGLRAAMVGVAVIPVLVIPFLLGGLDWAAVLGGLALNVSSFFCALAAGLLASSRQIAMHRAVLWAYVWAVALFSVLLVCGGWWLSVVHSSGLTPSRPAWRVSLVYSMAVLLNFEHFSAWGMVGGTGLGLGLVLVIYAGVIGGGLVAFLVVLGWSAANLRQLVLERPPSPLRLKLERVFCTPKMAVKLLRRWMRWRLERNPLGWLEQRTWQARLVTWSWLAVLVSIYSLALTEPNYFSRSFDYVQNILSFFLLGSMAATAAASFRRERESRVLELLLVSPLTTRQIVRGRLWGLWGQFLPASVLLVGVWVYMTSAAGGWDIFTLRAWTYSTGDMLYFVAAFAALPVVGLYFSLRCRTLLTAFVLTLACVFLMHWAANFAYSGLIQAAFRSPPITLPRGVEAFGEVVLPALLWVLLAWFLGWRLCRNLDCRRFLSL